jgi:uncharacterized protein
MIQAGNVTYRDAQDFPEIVPLFPLGGSLLLPGGMMPLNIFEPRYMAMIDSAMAGDRLIGMVQPSPEAKMPRIKRRGANSDLEQQNAAYDMDPPLAQIGGLGRIVSFNESGDGRYIISLAGICRFRLLDEVQTLDLFRTGRIAPFLADLNEPEDGQGVDRDALLRTFRAYLDANQMETDWDSIKRASNQTLVNALSMMSPFGPPEKQALLEAHDLKTRAETLVAITEVHLALDGKSGGKVKLQ